MLKKITFLLSTFILFSCSDSDKLISREFYKSVHFLNQKNDSLTIKQVIALYQKGDFNVPMENKAFYNLKGLETSWLHFKIDDFNEDLYFSIWSAFLDYGKVYTYSNLKINELEEISLLEGGKHNSLYRFPPWKLKATQNNADVFLKIKDSKRITSLKFLLNNSDNFASFTQKDTSVIILILAFLLTMLVIVLSLFIAKKQYSLLLYGAYIITFSIELLINHGIDLQINLFTTAIGHQVKRTLFQTLGGLFMVSFFTQFYPFNSSTKREKRLFKLVTIYLSIAVVILLSFLAFDTIYIPKRYIVIPSRIALVLVLVLHFILIKKKILPLYLGIGFSLPLLSIIRFLTVNPQVDMSLIQNFIIDNLLYISFTLEMLLIVYYIISRLVKSEFLAINLQNENLELRSSFQSNILEIQTEERNRLVSNVHDSFGGYLEALKLRLLQKSENTPEKIQEILDAFYKEYRYLLNSLHSPKINSENFTENLIEFFDKLNQLTSNNIKHHFSLEDSKLSQEKCAHLYSVISELTTNAIKYSKASEIKIEITQENKDQITLLVSDNGIGFDQQLVSKKGFGINNIKTRVQQMNGDIKINSIKNKGTTVTIHIPKND